jgi:hypothetical protein
MNFNEIKELEESTQADKALFDSNLVYSEKRAKILEKLNF